MSLLITCPHCGSTNQVAPNMAGQLVPCKACGQAMAIPANVPQQAPPPMSGSSGAGTAVAVTAGVSGAVIALIIGVTVAIVLICGGLLAALLIPAFMAAGEAASRVQSQNNLKIIGIAMHTHSDYYKNLPRPYTEDEDGNRLHSWRTAILPFIEEQYLFDTIDQQAAWDAGPNSSLKNTPIETYSSPLADLGTGETNYMVVVGPDTMFPGGRDISFGEVQDGLSNTIMVVEVPGEAAPWASTTDITIDELIDRISNASSRVDTFNVAFGDGSVLTIPTTIDPETLRALCTRNGAEPVSSFDAY